MDECNSYTLKINICSFVLLIFYNFKIISLLISGKSPVENQHMHFVCIHVSEIGILLSLPFDSLSFPLLSVK